MALGWFLGALTASHVRIRHEQVRDELVPTESLVEQEYLARRHFRAGDSFRTAVHFLNMADLQGGYGLRWLQRRRSTTYWERLITPWTEFTVADDLISGRDLPKHQAGARLLEAQYRARAAIVLERLGETDLAEKQWRIADDLDPYRSAEQLRNLVEPEFSVTPNPLLEAAAAAYLDSETNEELAEALKSLRQRFYPHVPE